MLKIGQKFRDIFYLMISLVASSTNALYFFLKSLMLDLNNYQEPNPNIYH